MIRNGCLALALIALALVAPAPARASQTFDDVAKVNVTLQPATAARGQTVTLKITVELAGGWHTYPTEQLDPEARDQVNKFQFPDTKDVVFVGTLEDPAGFVTTADLSLNIKAMRQYQGKVVWERPLVVRPDATPGKTKVKVVLTVLACDESHCLPPARVTPELDLTVTDAPPQEVESQYREQVQKAMNASRASPPLTSPPGNGGKPKDVESPPQTAKSSEEGKSPESSAASAESSSGYQRSLEWVSGQLETQKATPSSSLAFILAGIFWGAVSLVTPCVFPMIPITVSFFLKQSEKEHHRPITMALVYCGTIVIVLTIAAVLLLSAFRYLSTNPYMNIGLGVLFVVFALSLFGMYDLALPSGMARFTSSREGKGGLVGTMFMALTFTIVSFACVAPFLGGFGGTSASSQISLTDRILGGFAFAATFASPFFVLALFPTLLKKLPRSGTWLNSVKVVMGFLELAAALVFFRTSELVLLPSPVLFTYDLVMGLWIAIMLMCGLYLLNLFRLPHDTPLEHLGVPRMLFGLLFVGLSLYLLPALFKGGAEGEKQRPNGVIYAWIDSFLLPDSGGRAGKELPWAGDLKKTIEDARAQYQKTRKPALVLIDFTGKTCKNCRYNEQNVFTKPEIAELMRKYQLVQLYTDTVPPELYPPKLRDKIGSDGNRLRTDAAANLEFQKKAFATEQLPLYVILDPAPQGDEKKIEVKGIYAEGKINDPSAFAEFLKEPLGAAGQRAQAGR
jgi:thiol:disulfide interchange protein DsbD